jgi:hypothetical protein
MLDTAVDKNNNRYAYQLWRKVSVRLTSTRSPEVRIVSGRRGREIVCKTGLHFSELRLCTMDSATYLNLVLHASEKSQKLIRLIHNSMSLQHPDGQSRVGRTLVGH